MSTPEAVNAFWFGPAVADDVVPETAKQWFNGGQATDDAIRERFGALIEPARRGELDTWAQTPLGALALVVVLDQFSRNVHRGTPEAFACDAKALEHARAALARGDDLRVSPIARTFFYLPFEHSEALADQNLAVEKTAASREGQSGAVREVLDMFHDYAVRHRVVVERFGRFPHRNNILGRTSTAEEIEFLKQPGSSF